MSAPDRVLITRPLGPGRQLCEALQAQAIAAIQVPLVTIEPCPAALAELPARLAELPAQSLVIAVSRSAAELACGRVDSWPSTLHYWAVGAATARQWQGCNGNPIGLPQLATSEGLLAMPQLHRLSGRHVLILRGHGGRERLAEGLRRQGAAVDYAELYRRVSPALDGNLECQRWQSLGVNTLLVTSGDILHNLQALVPPVHQTWLHRCHLIVVSERIAHMASTMGFENITIAAGADDHSLITCLKQVAQRS